MVKIDKEVEMSRKFRPTRNLSPVSPFTIKDPLLRSADDAAQEILKTIYLDRQKLVEHKFLFLSVHNVYYEYIKRKDLSLRVRDFLKKNLKRAIERYNLAEKRFQPNPRPKKVLKIRRHRP